MSETTVSEGVLARLEALTARLDEQAAEIAALKAKTDGLEAENARLTTALTTPAESTVPAAPAATSRREMLRRVLGASAAAGVLLLAKEAGSARADTRTTLIPGSSSTPNYGLAATYGAGVDPSANLPTNIAAKTHGVVGVDSKYTGPITYSSGVLGTTESAGAAGVQGLNTNGRGVYGRSMDLIGVHGTSEGTSINSIGVSGEGGRYGVQGTGTESGVLGVGAFYGVRGMSEKWWGVEGYSPYGVGVRAQAGYWALHAMSPNYAGVFEGNVYVTGSLTVASGAKSAAVRKSNGQLARVYCQESPEPRFEDFGNGQLIGGKATIRLDSDFADIVKSDDYSVFPTPEGDCNGLYVANKMPQAFEVRELKGGTSTVPFSYRVVTRRKDPVGRRLEEVAAPDFSKFKDAPRRPEPPRAPDPSSTPNRPGEPAR